MVMFDPKTKGISHSCCFGLELKEYTAYLKADSSRAFNEWFKVRYSSSSSSSSSSGYIAGVRVCACMCVCVCVRVCVCARARVCTCVHGCLVQRFASWLAQLKISR